eukprot:m51a1_g9312 putative serine-threonine protein (514) ;mRNA; f:104753-106523
MRYGATRAAAAVWAAAAIFGGGAFRCALAACVYCDDAHNVTMVPDYPANATIARATAATSGFVVRVVVRMVNITDAEGPGPNYKCYLRWGAKPSWSPQYADLELSYERETTPSDTPAGATGLPWSVEGDVWSVNVREGSDFVADMLHGDPRPQGAEITAYCRFLSGPYYSTDSQRWWWVGLGGKNFNLLVNDPPVCGDGVLDAATEQCDNALDPNCDNCTCTLGAYRPLLGLCSLCGNGRLDAGEQCDGGLGCTLNCTCGSVGTTTWVPQAVAGLNCTTCGNKRVDTGEQCDGGDLCTASCACQPDTYPNTDGPGCLKRPSGDISNGAILGAIAGGVGGALLATLFGIAIVLWTVRKAPGVQPKLSSPVKLRDCQRSSCSMLPTSQGSPGSCSSQPVIAIGVGSGTSSGCNGISGTTILYDAAGNPMPVIIVGKAPPPVVTPLSPPQLPSIGSIGTIGGSPFNIGYVPPPPTEPDLIASSDVPSALPPVPGMGTERPPVIEAPQSSTLFSTAE